MKRIYITAVPLGKNFLLEKKILKPENLTLNTDRKEIYFPIVPIIESTMNEGDEAKVIAVQHSTEENPNLEILKEELATMKDIKYSVEVLANEESQHTDILVGTFEGIINKCESNASYYADITFGAKPFPIIVFASLNYAEKILERTDIKGIYYQEILRVEGKSVDAKLYNVSALYSMSSIIDQIRDFPAASRKSMITMLLNPTEV